MLAELVGGHLDAERLSAQAASSRERAWRRRDADGFSRPAGGGIGRVEPAIELVGERGPLVVLVGQLEQERLDLGPEHRPDLVGVDDRVEPLASPRPPGPRGRTAGACVLRALGQEPRHGDPDRELGLLDGVVLAGLGLELADDLGPVEPRPRLRDRSPAPNL